MSLLIIIGLGMIAGSFLTAFVDRLHDGRSWIRSRSECDACQHKLAARDLIPLISWLLQAGRCRYCRHPIRAYYPLLELSTMTAFVVFYSLWPYSLSGWDLPLLALWGVMLILLIALVVYDGRWFLLPNRIIYPGIILALLILIVRLLAGHEISLAEVIISALIGGGIFYIIFQISEN